MNLVCFLNFNYQTGRVYISLADYSLFEFLCFLSTSPSDLHLDTITLMTIKHDVNTIRPATLCVR